MAGELRHEDRYFLEQDEKLRAKLREELEAKAKAAAEHRHIAEQVGVSDEQLAARIRELGFEGETARVLHLFPLVAVAWADGQVGRQERAAIFRVAETHGIKPGTKAANLLASMLEKRPAKVVQDQILEVLRDILRAKGMHPHSVLDACVDIAEAGGGFLGIGGKVSAEERELIEQLAKSLGHEEAIKRLE